ncbi:MAG: hypothetical protein ABI585_07475 [Betaproteobacteria bacterium]
MATFAGATAVSAQGKAAQTLDVSARNAVGGECAFTPNPTSTLYSCALYTVPAGKLLIVRTVGFRVAGGTSPVPMNVLFGRFNGLGLFMGSPRTYSFAIPPPSIAGSFAIYAANHLTEFVLDENDRLDGSMEFNAAPALLTVLTFSGYTIDK